LNNYYRLWIERNPDKPKAKCRKHYQSHKAHYAEKQRKRIQANPEKRREETRRWEAKNIAKRAAAARVYEKANANKIAARKRAYRQRNRERIREVRAVYKRKRAFLDPLFRILNACRTRMHAVFRSNMVKKSTRSLQLIGCTSDQLREHIQSRFKPGMHWNNFGEWEIDHIIPCKHFNLVEESEQLKCFHYSNLQPLWAEENRRKSAKILAHYSSSNP
jgi:hypothetical protein